MDSTLKMLNTTTPRVPWRRVLQQYKRLMWTVMDPALRHAGRQKKLTAFVVQTAKDMVHKWNDKPKKGQHQRTTKDDIGLPVFEDDVIRILNFGSKTQVAAIVKDLYWRDTKSCDSVLRRKLILEYPALDNALLRNNHRRSLKQDRLDADLSEESEQEPELQPTPGHSHRTINKGDCLDRKARRKAEKDKLVEKALDSLGLNGFTVIGPKRWDRADVPYEIDDKSRRRLTICELAQADETTSMIYSTRAEVLNITLKMTVSHM